MKLVLCLFEQLSGFKINFQKSVFSFGKLKKYRINIDNYLVVNMNLILSSIWGFQYISVKLKMENGSQLRNGFEVKLS
jgi:hypothetical protein